MISHRLQQILDWVQAQTIADIGCDHAYIAAQAILEGRAQKAYACDVAAGPLEHARQTITMLKLEEQVIPLLMDGIEQLPADTGQIIMAGMGGHLMMDILEAGRDQIPPHASLLLSPHKDAPALRQYLYEHGFVIEKERTIQEGRHFYPLMAARFGQSQLDFVQRELGVNPEASLARQAYLQDYDQRLARIPAQSAAFEKAGRIRQAIAAQLKDKDPGS